jgi:pimeloyl-ACP methyl ester carboxylesterase
VSLVAHELGDPTAAPLVFLHALGVGTSGRYVAEVAPLLRRRVIGVDAPGFGGTPGLSVEEYGTDRYVPEPERVSAIALLDSGHLDYADQPGVDPELPLEAWVERAAGQTWRWPSREAFLAELREDAARTTPAYEQAVLAGMVEEPDGSVRGPAPEVRGAVYKALAGTRATAVWPAIDAAGIPTLLVYATEPPERAAENEAGAERLRASIGRAETVPLPGATHDVIADAGPALAVLVADWLDAVSR